MKKITKFMQVMVIILLSSSLAIAQNFQGENAAKVYADKSPYSSNGVIPPSDVIFDLEFSYPVSVANGEAGIETDGIFIYTTQWSGNTFNRYLLDGTYIGSFSITGVVNIRDLAYDGTYFYGSDASSALQQMDFTPYNETLISTITAPTAVRAVAYDEDLDVFYGNNWSTNISCFDRFGVELYNFAVGPVGTDYYGLAYDNYCGGPNPYLWGYAHIGATNNELVQINLPTGVETGVTFDVGTLIGATQIAGGLCIADNIVPGEWSFVGLVQNEFIWGAELCVPAPAAPANDMVCALIDAPSTGVLGSTEPVTIIVFNKGSVAQSNVPVSYILDGGAPVNEFVPGPIPQNGYVTYTFGTTADCSTLGPHTITTCTNLAGDADASNDCLTKPFDSQAGGYCQYEVCLSDDYGDGWNGGTLDVFVNGTLVYDNLTLANGYGPECHLFYVNSGDDISFDYTAGGWAYENEYYVNDSYGVEVDREGAGGVEPGDMADITAVCPCCEHYVVLTDDYGDGWNGGMMDILVNGTVVLDDITIASGFGPETYYFDACTGDDIDADYTAGGWAYENVYQVFDAFGTLLGESGQGGVEPGDVFDMLGNCVPPLCPVPTDLTETIYTSSGVTLGWTSVESFFDVYIDVEGAAPPTLTTTPTVDDNAGNSLIWSDGVADQNYVWWVRTDCGQNNTDVSSWVGPGTFYSPCTLVSIPYSEDFDKGDEWPTCWWENGDKVWFLDGGTGPGYYAIASYYNQGHGYLYSPAFDGTSNSNIHVEFFHYWRADYLTEHQDGYFYGSPDGGTTQYLLGEWHHNNPAEEWGMNEYDISSWADGASNIVFWWDIDIGDDYYWAVDNFQIKEGSFSEHGLWTGAVNNDWHTGSNWADGFVPGEYSNVTINTGLLNYPTITAEAYCYDIFIGSDASGTATLVDDGHLIVNGTATVQRYYPTGAPTFDEWHLISAPISNAQSGIYETYYLQWYQEGSDTWFDIVPLDDPLTSLQGFALYTPNDAMTFNYVGSLGNGSYGLPISAFGPDNWHWNLFGNPYPSALDWDLVAPVNIANMQNGAVYYLDQATGAYVSYNGGMGGGSRYVPPGQGFFITGAIDMAPFVVDNTMRTHTGGSAYYKAEFDNILELEASGEEFSNTTYLRFDESATNGIDKQFDAYKMFTATNVNLPEIYTMGEGTKLSINVLPETAMVPAGFKVGIPGEYTIGIKEVEGMANVVLEDLVTGEQTDLFNSSYTFTSNIDDPEGRFILHFTPLSISDNLADMISIYSNNMDVYVSAPENTHGEIYIFNLMGQEVAKTTITGTLNKITLNKSAYYIVKVMSNDGLVTQKVFVK